MKILVTARGRRRISASRKYLEENFSVECGRDFEDEILETVRRLPDNPRLGREAFPQINRPEMRKILCRHYNCWIYYRATPRAIEILSVRHTLMSVRAPHEL